MFNKTRYRSLERTLVMDTRIRGVTDVGNNVLRRQSSAVGVPEQSNYAVQSLVVGPQGYQLGETKGLLYIDVAYPISLTIGDTILRVTGQFSVTGALPPVTLISEEAQSVNVIQY